MAVIPTQTDYELTQLKVRNNKIKVEVLNFNFQTIDLIEGNVIDGSVNVDATADIRRTCSISIVPTKKYQIISEGGEFWLDKYIKIYEGIDNPRNNNETEWWNLGIFMINNPNRVYNSTTNTISFEGLDLMAKLTGRRNGQLPAMATLVPVDSKIADVVKQIITQLGGFNEYVIQDEGLTIPYDIKKETGAYIYDLLAEIRDLYSDWEMFFDVEGVFHWQKIPSGVNSPVVLNFDELKQPIVIDAQIDVDFENVKNNIIVYGRMLDDGKQVQASISDIIGTSPFNINKIGKINYIIDDEKIYSNSLALQRATYELYLHARLNDAITLQIVPTYWLNDVNVKIVYSKPSIGIEGEYLIKTLEIPLGIGNNMSINAMKIYSEEVALEDMTDDQKAVYYAQLYWISQDGTLDNYNFYNAGMWEDGRFIVIASLQATEIIESEALLVNINTAEVEPSDMNEENQAIYLAQQYWIDNYGGTGNLVFSLQGSTADGSYIIAVSDPDTTAVQAFLLVNLKTGIVRKYR